MKLQPKNLLLLISQAIAVLLLFCPGVYIEETWLATNIYGSRELVHETAVSFITKLAEADVGRTIGILTVLIMFIILVMFVIQFCAKKHLAISSVFTLLQTVFLLVYSLGYVEEQWDVGLSSTEYAISFLFFVILATMITVATTTFVANHKIKQDGILADTANTNNLYTSTNCAAELKEYKELLDIGAITQEEFDAKKKQLLDL